MPETPPNRDQRKDLINQLFHGERTPTDLAHEHNLSLESLATWVADPANARILAALAHLADIRTQLLLTRYRASAAARLITIATADEPSELSRKACVDLLKADLKVFSRSDKLELDQAVDEQAIITALEELGREPGDD